MNRMVVVVSQEELENRLTLSEAMREADSLLHQFNTDLGIIDTIRYVLQDSHNGEGKDLTKEEKEHWLEVYNKARIHLDEHSRDAQSILNNIRKLLDGKTVE